MSDDIRQHIQTGAVRHSHLYVFDAKSTGALDQLIEQGNDCFAALNRESLLAEEFRVQKAFELLGRNQFPENSLLDLDVNRLGGNKLAPNLLAQPEFFFLSLNVPVLGADFATISTL